jgi:hypothetical protein
MARRIAAHANAARGENILWVIGIDEKARTVPGALWMDLASWWPQVQACFDGVSPRLFADVNVPCEGVTIVALCFETDRAPFVVKNSEGGKIQFEVPWREGTMTRSARREDLMRILLPAVRKPIIEILGMKLQQTNAELPKEGMQLCGLLEIDCFFEISDERDIFIPFHRCSGTIQIDGGQRIQLVNFVIHPQSRETTTMAASASQIHVRGPGRIEISAYIRPRDLHFEPNVVYPVEIEARLPIIGIDAAVIVSGRLKPGLGRRDCLGVWEPWTESGS